MKQLLILVVLGYALYQGYLQLTKPDAFNPDGSAQVLLFGYDECGSPCNDARRYLEERVVFEEIDLRENEETLARFQALSTHDISPLIVVGDQKIEGFWPPKILGALAGAFGLEGVNSAQRTALAKNFDAAGNPQLVMYVTQTCGYCKRARSFFKEENLTVTEFDIERDPVARRDFEALHGGGTPLIFKGFMSAYGFNPAQISRDLQL